MRKQSNKCTVISIGLLVTAVILFFTCQASPRYATNTWVDTNAMMTMGRAWLNGQVPFRDLFEQRGPVMYLIYLVAALISSKSFIGLYVLEVLAATVSFYFLHRIAAKINQKSRVVPLVVAAVMMEFIYATTITDRGGSPEEFAVPLVIWLVARFVDHDFRVDNWRYRDFAYQGIALSLIFWLKYSLVGIWVGFFLAVGCVYLCRRQLKRFVAVTVSALAGFIGTSLLPLGYFAAVGGLKDLIQTYFIVNLKSYPPSGTLVDKLRFIVHVLRLVFDNNTLVISLGFGAVAVTAFWLFRRRHWQGIVTIGLMVFLDLLVTYYAGRPYAYYFVIVVALLAPFVAVVVTLLANKLTYRRYELVTISLAIFGMTFIAGYGLRQMKSENRVATKTTAQQDFAAYMHRHSDHPTLLQLGFIDSGFYMASQTLPEHKYFEWTNIPYANFKTPINEQVKYITHQHPQYIVVVEAPWLSKSTNKLLNSEYRDVLASDYRLVKKRMDKSSAWDSRYTYRLYEYRH